MLQLSMISAVFRRFSRTALLIALLCHHSRSVGFAVDRAEFRWDVHQDRDLELLGPKGVICRLVFNAAEGKPFFHPLNALDGTTISGLRPADHPHHLGLWFSWKFINGADYWSIPSVRDGNILLDRVSVTRTDAKEAEVLFDLSYQRKSESPILKERRQIRISVPEQDGTYRIDWHLQFEALDDVVLSAAPLEKADSGGYAGLSYRPIPTTELTNAMAPEWLNSMGATDRVLHTRPYREMNLHAAHANWCDISLRFGGDRGNVHGLSVFSHPDNPRSPPRWHVAAPTGFLNPMPLYKDSWSVAKGEKFQLQYRVLIHPGRGNSDQLNGEYKSFSRQQTKTISPE